MDELQHQPQPIRLVKGQEYGSDIREWARQRWTWQHGRNAAAVAREMRSRCPHIDADTVNRWAARDGWATKARDDLKALAPAIHESIVTDLIAGAGEAAAYVRTVVRGDDMSADYPRDPETGKPTRDVAAHQTRVTAALGLLDRAGFAPRKDAGPLTPPASASPAEVIPDTTDTASLVQRMQRMIQDSRQG